MKKRFLVLLGMLLLLGVQFSIAQTKVISGIVTSEQDGVGIPGVSVVVKGTSIGTTTNAEGKYTINASPEATTLIFSFVGMKTEEVAIGGRAIIDVVLGVESLQVEDLVVVGYGVQRKREVTGSIAKVKGDELTSLATPSFESLLSGKSAGVQVSSTTGVIGQAPRIRIRGIGSISQGTYPLVVVDGIPIFTGDLGGYADNNALGDINPADIESVEILKDGSATAIYGSRAANGVMLITTKKGTQGKFKLSYNNYFGVASPVDLFSLLNANQFIEIANEKRANCTPVQTPIAETLTDHDPVNVNWQKAVLRERAYQQDHNLSLSGSNDITNYYFSLGYSTQEGVTKPNEMKRYTFRANVDQKIRKWLTVGANAGITHSEYVGLNTGTNSLSGNIFAAIRMLPNTPIYDAENPTGYNISSDYKTVGAWNNAQSIDDNLPNIVYVLNKNKFQSKIFRTIANTYALVNFLPSLNFKSQASVDYANTEGFRYYNPLHGDGQGVNGRINNNYQNLTRWNWQNVLSFNKTFGTDHNVNAVLVNEFQGQTVNSFFASGTNIADPYFNKNIISGSYGTQLSGGSLADKGFISFAGRLNYNYAGKYFLQASIRRDAISDLSKDNREASFPGASIGWTISKESFMESLSSVLSDLKVRASYAEVGNVSIGDSPFMGLFDLAKYADYNGIQYGQFGNSKLKWETSKKTDIGFDAAFMDGKYKFSFDYYINDQDGLILKAPTPPSFGVPNNSINMNIGRSKNWGYEFYAEATVYRTKDISVVLDANLTLARNEISELVNHSDILETYTIIREGESFRSIYAWDYVGVNKANGNPMYRKADGTIIQGNILDQKYYVYDSENPNSLTTESTLAASDRKIFGPSLPKYYGAVNAKVRYKDFDFSVMFRYSGGNYIMNKTRDDLTNLKFQNNGTEILGRWQSVDEPGDGWTPRLYYLGDNFMNLSNGSNGRFVEKGDFIKLQNITLGYNMPKKLLQKVGIDNLRVFVQLQDFWMHTKYKGIDPEMESAGVDYNGTPRQRVATFGINMSL